MGTRVQELRVYCTDANRGRCRRELSLHPDESQPLTPLQLYRCFVVWRSKLIMILPVLLWCAVAGTCTVSFRVD